MFIRSRLYCVALQLFKMDAHPIQRMPLRWATILSFLPLPNWRLHSIHFVGQYHLPTISHLITHSIETCSLAMSPYETTAMANDYSRAARDEKTCRARAIENRIQHQSLAHIAIHAEENDKRKNRNAPVGSINLSKLKRRCCCHLGDAHFD